MPLTRQVFNPSQELPSDLHALMQQVLSLVKNIDAKVDGMEAKVNAKIDAIEAKVNAKVDAKVDGIEAKMEAWRADHGALKEQVETAVGKLDDIRADCRAVRKQVEEVPLSVESLKNVHCITRECKKYHTQEFYNLVHEYIADNNWSQLQTGLLAVLGDGSEAYKQLQQVQSVYDVGNKNYIQLASLLLCAGLPVSTTHSGSGGNVVYGQTHGYGYGSSVPYGQVSSQYDHWQVYGSGSFTTYNSGRTMLHGAARGGRIQLTRLLLDRGANVNARNDGSYTPLMDAANSGHLEVVKCLVQAGANTTIKNNSGRTALGVASGSVHTYLQNFQQ